jgi:hypothetical protein
MLAPLENRFVAENHAVPGHQVVAEHRNRAASPPVGAINFEFDLDAGLKRQAFTEAVQFRAVAAFLTETIAPEKNIKLQIIVRPVAVRGPQNPAFAAAVAPTQDDSRNVLPRNLRGCAAPDLIASSLEAILQLPASVNGESGSHGDKTSILP